MSQRRLPRIRTAVRTKYWQYWFANDWRHDGIITMAVGPLRIDITSKRWPVSHPLMEWTHDGRQCEVLAFDPETELAEIRRWDPDRFCDQILTVPFDELV